MSMVLFKVEHIHTQHKIITWYVGWDCLCIVGEYIERYSPASSENELIEMRLNKDSLKYVWNDKKKIWCVKKEKEWRMFH